jgi:hypothetical protein
MLLCVGLASAALVPSAGAAPKAKVSLALPSMANEGAAISFSWTGRHLGPNHRLVLQKPVGTAHVWKSIMRLNSNSGSAEMSGLPLGTYRLRIADLIGRRVIAQQVGTLPVYGQVPFSTLFNDHQSKVQTTPQYTFPWVVSHYDGDGPTAFQVSNNNCLSVHIGFVSMEYYNHGATGTETLTLVQESKEPVSTSVAYNAIGSLDAELVVGQSWAVSQSHLSEHQGSPTMTYINGYAICKSAEPFRS